MKYFFLLFMIFSSFSYSQNYMSYEQAKREFRSLSNTEMRNLVKQALTNSCIQDNVPYSYCECSFRFVVEQLNNNEVREVLLPSTYWKYLTKEVLVEKVFKGLSIAARNCMIK